MSTFRKTAVATAIIGAGLASTAGTALAHDGHAGHDGHGHDKTKHESSGGCSNSYLGRTGDSSTFLGALDGSQGAIGANVCDVLSHNEILNHNSVTIGGKTLPTPPTMKTEGSPQGED